METAVNNEDAEIRVLTPQSMYGPYYNQYYSNWNSAGIPVSPYTALEASTVLACVRVKAESLASMPWRVYRHLPGGGRKLAELPLNRVLSRRPNSWQSPFDFIQDMEVYRLLWGNAYARIVPGRLGSVTELIPLHPSRMQVKRLENGRLRYIYQDIYSESNPGSGQQKEYSQDEIFHVRGISPDCAVGYLSTSLSQESIALARATEIASSAYFGNGAMPGMVLTSQNPLKPEILQRLKRSWDEIHKGANNSSRTAVLPPGIDVKSISHDAKNSDLIEARKFQVEDIARVFRVPGYLIGHGDQMSYSSVELAAKHFLTFSLMPEIRRWESAARRDLINEDDDDHFIEFDTSSFLAADAEATSRYCRELFQVGALSVNDVRERIGMNPVDDGEKRFVPVNLALLSAFTDGNPTGQSGAPVPPPTPDGPAIDQEGNADPVAGDSEQDVTSEN